MRPPCEWIQKQKEPNIVWLRKPHRLPTPTGRHAGIPNGRLMWQGHPLRCADSVLLPERFVVTMSATAEHCPGFHLRHPCEWTSPERYRRTVPPSSGHLKVLHLRWPPDAPPPCGSPLRPFLHASCSRFYSCVGIIAHFPPYGNTFRRKNQLFLQNRLQFGHLTGTACDGSFKKIPGSS